MRIKFAATLFALASLPLLAQQTPAGGLSNPPGAQPGIIHEQSATPLQTGGSSNDHEASPSTASPAAVQSVPVEMRPVSAQLVNKLDSKTARTGDNVAVETGASLKTADGTEIPKGSMLVGHVLAARPSGGQNSQVVLQFDQAELKDGQKLPIQTEIESIALPAGESSHGEADATPSSAMNGASMDNAPRPTTAMPPSGAMATGGARGVDAPGAAPSDTMGTAATAAPVAPAAGTIVSRNGKIAVRTTSVPGLLLANNAPGEHDPRMAKTAGILVGTQRDIQLEGGTQIVIGVASAATETK